MLNKKKENVSAVMLLPVLRINKKLTNNFYNYGFKNTFLYSAQLKDVYKFNTIYLLFEPDEFNSDFNEFIFELSTNPNFIEIIDIGYKKVLLTFKVPDQFKEDYKLFEKGKYSQLSDLYKKCFNLEKPVKNERGDIKRDLSGGVVMEPTTFFHIFNRTKKLREIYQEKLALDFELSEEMELYDIINIEKETLSNLILN